MEWAYDARTHMYILTVDQWRCHVWPLGDLWSAIVADTEHTINTAGWTTMNEAKAWCLERLAEFRANEQSQ